MMGFFKKLALFTTVTLGCVFLIVWSFDSFGFRNPISAFLVNWLVMSWVAIIGQVVHFSFSPGYYDIKRFEQSGLVYERLGIRLFKKLVRRGPLSIFNPTFKLPKEKTVSALQSLENEMRKAETGHVLIFILMLLFAGIALIKGWLDAVVWMMLFNMLINGYPTMLQRYNRIKLQELVYKRSLAQP